MNEHKRNERVSHASRGIWPRWCPCLLHNKSVISWFCRRRSFFLPKCERENNLFKRWWFPKEKMLQIVVHLSPNGLPNSTQNRIIISILIGSHDHHRIVSERNGESKRFSEESSEENLLVLDRGAKSTNGNLAGSRVNRMNSKRRIRAMFIVWEVLLLFSKVLLGSKVHVPSSIFLFPPNDLFMHPLNVSNSFRHLMEPTSSLPLKLPKDLAEKSAFLLLIQDYYCRTSIFHRVLSLMMIIVSSFWLQSVVGLWICMTSLQTDELLQP